VWLCNKLFHSQVIIEKFSIDFLCDTKYDWCMTFSPRIKFRGWVLHIIELISYLIWLDNAYFDSIIFSLREALRIWVVNNWRILPYIVVTDRIIGGHHTFIPDALTILEDFCIMLAWQFVCPKCPSKLKPSHLLADWLWQLCETFRLLKNSDDKNCIIEMLHETCDKCDLKNIVTVMIIEQVHKILKRHLLKKQTKTFFLNALICKLQTKAKGGLFS